MSAVLEIRCVRPCRTAFTILELLTAISIVSLLFAISLPAVNAAREASRRSVCSANLRQLGLAVHNYHTQQLALPPAVVWNRAGEPLGGGVFPIGVIDRVARYGTVEEDTICANWLILLLPQLDQMRLYEGAEFARPVSASTYEAVRTAELPTLKCPSDPASDRGLHYLRGSAAGLTNQRYARGNYAVNVGPDAYCLQAMTAEGAVCIQGFIAGGGHLISANNSVWGSGIAGANKSFGFAHISDGLSHTVAVDEIRAGAAAVDPRGAWALGQVGASCIARHGRSSTGGGPNPPQFLDQFIGCGSLVQKLGAAQLHALGMPCAPEPLTFEVNTRLAARSHHPHGVHLLLCDGAVFFAHDSMDESLWHALHTRNHGEAIAVDGI